MLSFCSVMTITFLEFFLIIFKANTFDKVSIVLPDLDMIKNKIFLKFFFFFKN